MTKSEFKIKCRSQEDLKRLYKMISSEIYAKPEVKESDESFVYFEQLKSLQSLLLFHLKSLMEEIELKKFVSTCELDAQLTKDAQEMYFDFVELKIAASK